MPEDKWFRTLVILVLVLGPIAVILGVTLGGPAHKRVLLSSKPSPAPKLAMTLTTPTTQPIAGERWPISAAVHPAQSSAPSDITSAVTCSYLSRGTVISSHGCGTLRHGVVHGALVFPVKDVGRPLTVVVAVTVNGSEVGAAYRVTVQR